MNRTRIAIVGLALLATACTGGGGTTGTPTPGTSTQAQSPTSNSSAGEGKLASVKPCDLLGSSDTSQLGLSAAPEARKVAGAETCEWIDSKGGITVVVDAKKSAEKLSYTGATKEPVKFGSFDGFKVPAPQKTAYLCDAVISVDDSSHVQVVASAGAATTDTAKACELATKSADLIAAKLA